MIKHESHPDRDTHIMEDRPGLCTNFIPLSCLFNLPASSTCSWPTPSCTQCSITAALEEQTTTLYDSPGGTDNHSLRRRHGHNSCVITHTVKCTNAIIDMHNTRLKHTNTLTKSHQRAIDKLLSQGWASFSPPARKLQLQTTECTNAITNTHTHTNT